MRSLLDASLPVASSCGGDGVCAKCRVRVLEGMEHLSSETELERDLRDRHDYDENERVSCQVSVHGDILIDASYW
ncbi:MAG: (2Fe-2S)-binding protein [Bdellovibrionaceae bacterium]|nr:(2Fe-2S)-binding protein [Pseudobdellovibrionaceae bacterium]